MHVIPERYSEAVQPFADTQTSGEPAELGEVEPAAQAHTASLTSVPSVLLYVVPLLQTVIGNSHCDAG